MILSEIKDSIQKLSVKKLVIVGPPGSGKTTLGKDLSESFGIPLVQADSFFWKQNGEHLSEAELLSAIANDLSKRESWIFEGHFKTCHLVVLKDATLVIEIEKNFWSAFLDYCMREIKRKDTGFKTKLEKILFVPLNYRHIQTTKKNALSNFKGQRIRLMSENGQ